MGEANTKDYIAIIDIGSNAVRLVVYDGLNRAPVKLHNERNVCNLGADLGSTGRLNPEGVKKAIDSLSRFAGLIVAMKINRVYAVATAALRDAADGAGFIARVQQEFGLKIRIIDGEEEARLAALGVMMNGLGSGGIIGDYGGGSLELIVVEGNKVKHKASLPIGSHRLRALKTREARIKMIDEALETAPFLKAYRKQDFYALGGAWRSMARTHMRMIRHPLRVLDHYAIEGGKAADYARLIARQSPASLEKAEGLSKKRVQDMGVAALAMERLFEKIRPSRLVFSATGLREGLIYDRLPPAVQRQDALITGCRKVALKISRFDNLKGFGALLRWMEPLFKGEGAAFFRLLEASCLLSDTAWFEHEDYQAAHVFERILVLPFYGVDHPGRAFLGLSQYVRYAGHAPEGIVADPKAVIAGLAQRVAYLLTGGALSLLQHTELRVKPRHVVLSLKARAVGLRAEVTQEALEDLARAMGKSALIRA